MTSIKSTYQQRCNKLDYHVKSVASVFKWDSEQGGNPKVICVEINDAIKR